jgi:hypothetical protein
LIESFICNTNFKIEFPKSRQVKVMKSDLMEITIMEMCLWSSGT